MLAYVFWHWPGRGSDRTGYEAALLAFHAALRERRPAGFHRSHVFRLPIAPWLPHAGPVYEDWYLVEDFHALGLLNQGAISGVSRAPHDRIAHAADGGAGGLYRLRAGEAALPRARRAIWFSKPKGLAYDEFYRAIPAPALAASGGLWERQMVLGPAPECCLLAAQEIAIPQALGALAMTVEPVAP
jgi:hypothetical protein